MKFSDIKEFPHANYSVDVPFGSLRQWTDDLRPAYEYLQQLKTVSA